jgi:Short C-terminal domain
MGLIRKSLYLGTGGLISPNSKKQRLQMKQLAALQGATPEEIRRRGGRYDFDGLLGLSPTSVRDEPVTGQPSGDSRLHADRTNNSDEPGTMVRLERGYVLLITDPRTIRWLTAEADLSYRCRACDAERSIVAIGEDALIEADHTHDDADPSVPGQLLDHLERLASLHASGELTEIEFQAAKSRLLGE